MNENPSPRTLYFSLVGAGVVLGMTLAQLIFVLAGMVRYSDTAIVILAALSVWLLTSGWRMVSSLPLRAIYDLSDGRESDLRSIPSRNPAAREDLER